MITKRQACLDTIDKFCSENGISETDLTESYILQSSTLAVAMEYLGLLKDKEMKRYAS